MSKNTHLTPNQFSALGAGSFREIESDAVQRHLLICDECRGQVPLPSVDELWGAVLIENELDENAESEKSAPFRSPGFSWLSHIWNLRSGLIWAAGALVILLSLMFLFQMGIYDSRREVVQILEIKNEHGPASNYPSPNEVQDNNGKAASVNTNREVTLPDPKKLRTDLPGPKPPQNNLRQSSPKIVVKDKPLKISETRGVSDDCTGEQAFEMEFSPAQENYVFQWKKLPKAVKYHLYISDDDEILVDEFETSDETTFVLKKPLDPLKTYKWKIIVTLENGQTVVGTSQKFNINKFQYNLKKFNRKESLAVRCSANE
jgi:hypothetical protein